MRVLMLSWEYPPQSVGGIARHVDDLTRELARQGEEIHVLTSSLNNTPEKEVINHVHVYRAKAINVPARDFTTWILQLNFSLLKKAIEIWQSDGPFDLIHAHDWLVAFSSYTLKHLYKIPLISTIHATEYGRNQGLHNDTQRYISDVEWWLTYESWKVIVCSNYMKAELENIFQVPSDKIHIVPNGVEPRAFEYVDSTFSREEYALENEKIVFFVGRLVPEKGVQVLLDAVPKILCHCPDTKFVIAGKGPSEEYLKSKAHKSNIGEKIYFTGYIDDNTKNGLYRSSDVAVFPSTYEPFGIVALEAMAAHTPVVVSDVGGLSEIVEHGVDGLKIYSGNPNSLADNIIRLLKDPVLANDLQKKAYQKINNCFSWKKITRETRDVYQVVRQEFNNGHWEKPFSIEKFNPLKRSALLNVFTGFLKQR
ncbi:MAG: glycosyltransferase family 4 protein [Bacillota bacterium]